MIQKIKQFLIDSAHEASEFFWQGFWFICTIITIGGMVQILWDLLTKLSRF